MEDGKWNMENEEKKNNMKQRIADS